MPGYTISKQNAAKFQYTFDSLLSPNNDTKLTISTKTEKDEKFLSFMLSVITNFAKSGTQIDICFGSVFILFGVTIVSSKSSHLTLAFDRVINLAPDLTSSELCVNAGMLHTFSGTSILGTQFRFLSPGSLEIVMPADAAKRTGDFNWLTDRINHLYFEGFYCFYNAKLLGRYPNVHGTVMYSFSYEHAFIFPEGNSNSDLFDLLDSEKKKKFSSKPASTELPKALPLMLFDPCTGEKEPYPSEAAQYREWHGTVAWLYNPYTGTHRDVRDIGSDVLGILIVPPSKV